jgi:hypothetical protein
LGGNDLPPTVTDIKGKIDSTRCRYDHLSQANTAAVRACRLAARLPT